MQGMIVRFFGDYAYLIPCETREGNLNEFFQHENQSCPPSPSQDGKLCLPLQKSELAESNLSKLTSRFPRQLRPCSSMDQL